MYSQNGSASAVVVNCRCVSNKRVFSGGSYHMQHQCMQPTTLPRMHSSGSLRPQTQLTIHCVSMNHTSHVLAAAAAVTATAAAAAADAAAAFAYASDRVWAFANDLGFRVPTAMRLSSVLVAAYCLYSAVAMHQTQICLLHAVMMICSRLRCRTGTLMWRYTQQAHAVICSMLTAVSEAANAAIASMLRSQPQLKIIVSAIAAAIAAACTATTSDYWVDQHSTAPEVVTLTCHHCSCSLLQHDLVVRKAAAAAAAAAAAM
eukprot:21361-Heterococcus_DN1.PRE.2